MSAVVRWFASQSLRAKLLWINIATVILSSALVMAIVAAGEWQHAKKALLDNAYTQARILGSAASAPLVFDDAAGARDVIEALRLSPDVREGVVFRADRTVLARYGGEGLPAEFPAQSDGYVFRPSFLEVSQPVYFDRAIVGHIVLRVGLDAVRERLRWTAIACAIAAFAALGLGFLLGGRLREVVVGPILRLAQVTREISALGDYGRRAEVEGQDEVGLLAKDFNSMIEQIQRRSEALRESEARFRLMADGAPVLIWIAGIGRQRNWFNQPWLAFTGCAMQQELGDGWTARVHPGDLEQYIRIYGEAFKGHRKFAVEYRLKRYDGEFRWMMDQGIPRFEADGRFAGYVGACIDVTDKKQASEVIERINADLENRVQARTAELVAANRELESFTFATSHDLRGPLGRINSFSMLLEKNYRDRLDGDGLLFLDLIRQNATRLTHLVDDLLIHARVAQQELDLKPMDIAAVARAVVHEKADDFREAEAELCLDLAPGHVMGDFHSLHQALVNLLENALKYSAGSSPSIIEIGGRQTGERYLLWVRDNGIGFDMAYHDKIFEIFRRLHTYAEYQGSGVGLALVKRAVERLGGRVWAQSAPGQGATFFLELLVAEMSPA